ncbi:hypothetical protein GCWU000324_00462 [Kingella oralis ATCC 51147]|uniref:Uncharacterized protein n=1 Tax=Kingella oralis ATCC 51147 TaxID=629741 RepID=C4GHX3_9NEIS|nr:hypothetical protein GCWU000324_00462 [Kingella oralis ATCC 51147]
MARKNVPIVVPCYAVYIWFLVFRLPIVFAQRQPAKRRGVAKRS